MIRPRRHDGKCWDWDQARALRHQIRQTVHKKVELAASLRGKDIPTPDQIEDQAMAEYLAVCSIARDPLDENLSVWRLKSG